MNRRVPAAALLLVASACVPYSMIEPALQKQAAGLTGCRAEEIEISDYQGGAAGLSSSTYVATGCGRRYYCSHWVAGYNGGGDRAECRETAASHAASLRELVVDRLSLETGCPAEQIEMNQQARWTRGTETAYRLTACGKPYICSTAAGRTECKKALAE